MSSNNCVVNIGRVVVHKDEARTLIYRLNKFLNNLLKTKRAKYKKKYEIYETYMKSKGREPYGRAGDARWRNFTMRPGPMALHRDIRLLQEDLNEVSGALSILNNRLVDDVYWSSELCEIVNYYEPLLPVDNSAK